MPRAQSSIVHLGFDDKGHPVWGPEVKAKVVDAPKKAPVKKTEGVEAK